MTVSPKRRIALVSNLVTHYRRPLYELLAQRFELDCFFFAESEPYVAPRTAGFDLETGHVSRTELRRVNLLGQPLLPGLARFEPGLARLAGLASAVVVVRTRVVVTLARIACE